MPWPVCRGQPIKAAARRGDPSRCHRAAQRREEEHAFGAGLAAEMINIRPNLPIILCTGYSETVDESTAMSLGISTYLFKPISAVELSRAVRKALQRMETIA